MKKILIVAYHFPPIGGLGAAGSQRVLKFVRYLPASNWTASVLTLRETSYPDYLTIDSTLLAAVPDDTRVIRTKMLRVLEPLLRLKGLFTSQDLPSNSQSAEPGPTNELAAPSADNRSRYQKLKDSITDLFEIPDEVSGWLLPAVLEGRKVIKEQQADAILATGRPWTSLVVGALLRLLTRKPLVVDFRDPWMTNPFRLQHSGLKDWCETKLEAWVVRSADLVIANTPQLRAEFVERFGSAIESRCITILNGYDAADFDTINAKARDSDSEKVFLLSHSGFLYGKRDPRALIDAFCLLRDEHGISHNEIKCELVGPIELPYDLRRYVDTHDLSEFVDVPGQVTYAESLARLARADLGLIIQPGTGTQIPSKLFECIGCGKNILAIAPGDSAVAEIVSDFHLGVIADPENPNDIANAILRCYEEWSAGPEAYALPPKVRERFDVRRGVQALGDAMSEAL